MHSLVSTLFEENNYENERNCGKFCSRTAVTPDGYIYGLKIAK